MWTFHDSMANQYGLPMTMYIIKLGYNNIIVTMSFRQPHDSAADGNIHPHAHAPTATKLLCMRYNSYVFELLLYPSP